VHTVIQLRIAPVQTLTDREYQAMRDAQHYSRDWSGYRRPNIQFAVDPKTGTAPRDRNEPARVALFRPGFQATGFPIAKSRQKLARGYRLDELANESP